MAKILVNQTVGHMLAPLHFALITEVFNFIVFNLELYSMMLTKNAKFLVNFTKTNCTLEITRKCMCIRLK